MRIAGYAVAAIILLLSSCRTNPLVEPFDVFVNYTGGPYIEEKLRDDLALGRKSEEFVNAKHLELLALRELIKEAKGEP